ncbi:MAG: branched-chain-amino-acid transaminase [Phycisphaerales bacterium]
MTAITAKTPPGSTTNGTSSAQQQASRPAPPKQTALAGVWAKPNAVPAGDHPYIFVNGQMLPKNQAMVSVYDHGLLYGDGIFEGIRVYKGKIFKCGRHMDRLWKCAAGIHLEIPISREHMVGVMQQCIDANGIVDGYIRLVVTRGFGTLGLDPRKCPVPGVICVADQISLFPAEMYEQGMRVIVAHRPTNPLVCLDPRVKSLNYLNHIMAKVEGIQFGCHEVVRLNLDGDVCEGSGDNLFMIKNGVVYTPPPEAGILEGITREFVMQTICPALGVRCVEKRFKLPELLAADEVFLTGSAAEIICVTQIDQYDAATRKVSAEKKISAGEGPLTKRLRAKFREIVTSDQVPID